MGTVSPNSRFPIEFRFKPNEEVLYNFNITCDIRRKPNKLSINIKGEGYAVHPLIQLENTAEDSHSNTGINDHFITLKPAPAMNYADFGAVQVLDSISKTFIVTNNGKFNFDYSWENDVDVMMQSMLSLGGGKSGGTLHKGEKISYTITFAPTKETNIDGVVMSFVVAGKYVYNVMVKGSGVQPAIRFSFMHFDFGPCFVTSPGGNTVIEETTLRITNNDPVNNIGVDCAFQKIRALWVESRPAVLEPGGILDVPIRFAPRDVKDYAFVIPFVINGTGKVNVNITGAGILPRLELANAAQRRTNFGVIDVGTESLRTIVLANKSKRDLPVQLIDGGDLGGGLLADNCVSFFPNMEFIIPAHDKISLQLSFSPNRRIPQFTEDLQVKYAGVTRKLITVSGKAQGCEASLDTDSLPFGMVVTGAKKVKKLSLENSGDLSLTFNWVTSTFGPHFSITPLTGKIAPGNEVIFDVEFAPQFIDPDIRQDGIMLAIPGIAPLQITCSGMCVPQPTESIISLDFDCVVRTNQLKNISLKNPTDKDWFISPSMSGIHWSVPNELKIPAKSSADLVITYFPISMCSKQDSKGHQGQLFVPMPDGTAQLYKLCGYASPPLSSGTVTVDVVAKRHTMIALKMSNWLAETQKFHISIDPLEQPSPATFFVAANAVEVAPHGMKDFQIRFTSFLEGRTRAKVTFTNTSSGEYFFYEIVANAGPAQVIEDIHMESPVRQSAKQVISIENPLGKNDVVSMNSADWWSCNSKCIRVKELVPLSGNVEGSFELEYRPLTVTSQPEEYTVTIKTKELGNFIYKVIVKGLASSARQTLHFEVPLGAPAQTENFVFKAFNPIASTFNCSVRQQNLFSVNKTFPSPAVSSWDGLDSRVPVTFEPTEIGEIRDILTISSAEGGIYECELVGKCLPPLPTGPYYFTAGQSQAIPFRNCFDEVCQWSFVVDNPSFKIATASASVPSKTNDKCTVTFSHVDDGQSIASGANDNISAKLFISCRSKPHIPPWIVYLRGKI
jgi:hydrocephalus-inducing protein